MRPPYRRLPKGIHRDSLPVKESPRIGHSRLFCLLRYENRHKQFFPEALKDTPLDLVDSFIPALKMADNASTERLSRRILWTRRNNEHVESFQGDTCGCRCAGGFDHRRQLIKQVS